MEIEIQKHTFHSSKNKLEAEYEKKFQELESQNNLKSQLLNQREIELDEKIKEIENENGKLEELKLLIKSDYSQLQFQKEEMEQISYQLDERFQLFSIIHSYFSSKLFLYREHELKKRHKELDQFQSTLDSKAHSLQQKDQVQNNLKIHLKKRKS